MTLNVHKKVAMSQTKGKICEEDHNEQQYKLRRKEQQGDRDRLVIEALSSAEHVAGNKSFDQNIVTENHQGGPSLRTKIEQRWNHLVTATAVSNSSSTGHTDHGGISKQKSNKDDRLPTFETSSSWFQQIYDRHTEPGRHYHTVVHLWEMFELLDIVIANLSAPKWYVPMAWSVFFHDSIYDPKSNRNEKDSAELFRDFVDSCMGTAMDKVTFDTALIMILATEKHKVILPRTRSGPTSKEDEEEEIAMQEHFLDIDMAVLGKHGDAYFKYAALIRKEFEFVPHDLYCSKRVEILDTFLVGNCSTADNDDSSNNANGNKHIFLTDAFRGAFENRARENLRNEIELLRRSTIPG
jgi:predicted metal-dependent HD superfamily phosphohydrolase